MQVIARVHACMIHAQLDVRLIISISAITKGNHSVENKHNGCEGYHQSY